MLVSLSVKNFALISSLQIDFCKGLNVLSGETGAGKSIIIDCIMLLTGGRYDKSMLRYGEKSGFVEGVFALDEKTRPLFSDYIENDDDLIVTRKFNAEGKNEIKINGQTVTLSLLRKLTANLVDICGQNEHQSLAEVSNHIKVIDFYARKEEESILAKIAENYEKFREIANKLDEIGDAKTRARSLDVYKFELAEIEKAKLIEGEEDELIATRKKYLGAEKIADALSLAQNGIDGDDEGLSVSQSLKSAQKALRSISSYDSKFAEWADRLDSVMIECEDLLESVSDELDGLEFSPADLEKIERRLDKIRQITRKYGNYDAVMSYRNELIRKIDETENADELYEKYSKKKAELVKILYADSVELSQIRRGRAIELGKAVVKELAELGMENSVFESRFLPLPSENDCENKLRADGLDEVEFYLSPNVGQPLKPLTKIISGGEQSRFMLALKVVSGDSDSVPTLIFDEIDTGISGKIGLEVAKKMATISTSHQVLSVTHLPQISAMADCNYFISKSVKDGNTVTEVKLLDYDEQIDEIARLSGGKDISNQALASAKQMKEWSNNFKSELSKTIE
ncbi:MAG: DNA repair protein RecN [Clostridia bacterium]|nr:DNA repair protein RecN [Clostridia bacterium]